MATEQFANSASSTLNGAIISSDTSLVVTAATSFPSIPQFRILIDSEIILVTAVAGTTFTISRAQEGTTAAGHSNGATITHILTAGALSQYRDDVQLAKVLSGVTSNTTIVQTNEIVSIGTLSGAITITLPASPATGEKHQIKDTNGSAGVFNITISGNGKNIDGSSTFVMDVNYMNVTLGYDGTTWMIL